VSLLKELRIIQEEQSKGFIDSFYQKYILPLEEKANDIMNEITIKMNKLEEVKNNPELQKQIAKLEEEYNKTIKMIGQKYEEAGKVSKDKTFLDRISDKAIEFSNWTKENIGISGGTLLILSVPATIMSYLLINRKKIKEHGL
jgi:hypothetical protein